MQAGIGKLVSGSTIVVAPLGSQYVSGFQLQDIPVGNPENTSNVAPFGTTYSFEGETTPVQQGPGPNYFTWPTWYQVDNARMPALWSFIWTKHPTNCVDYTNLPYGPLPDPYEDSGVVLNPTKGESSQVSQQYETHRFNCITNSPNNLDFVSSNVNPQVVLDDALPASVQVSSFSPINASASITHLRLFSTSLSNPANMTASSVASDGSSAVFPYPTAAGGGSLPAGGYLATITTDPANADQTTNGLEPLYIAHDDTSFPSAFGVAVATPKTLTITSHVVDIYGDDTCAGGSPSTTSVIGGTQLPLVTLPTEGKLALGNASSTITVGSNPTVVLTYNDQEQDNTYYAGDICNNSTYVQTTGAQSALVVNTGSNSVSLVNIGTSQFPSGTVTVGQSPVSAVISPDETMAYVANYIDGTISEVNLNSVQQTRILTVMPHPTTLSYDSSGNLWVGGQGFLQKVNLASWSAGSAISVDGTINSMNYDASTNSMVSTILQNGTINLPSHGRTHANAIEYSTSSTPSSYATSMVVNVNTGSTTTSSMFADSASYTQSSVASYLAFPSQTSATPPIYAASTGNLTATATGSSFTVSVISTGKVLVAGTLPYPIRGIALSPTMIYFTMPESNSLVSLPIQLSGTSIPAVQGSTSTTTTLSPPTPADVQPG